MYTLTFKLKGRQKTFTDTTIEGAYEMFLIGYGEVLNEVKEVHIDTGDGSTNELSAKSFRENYRHVEDKVGDDVTEQIQIEIHPEKGGA